MAEPQVWTLITVFAAAMFGTLTLMSTMFVRVVRTEIGRLDTKIDALSEKFDSKFDPLDRDVQALIRHTFGIDRS